MRHMLPKGHVAGTRGAKVVCLVHCTYGRMNILFTDQQAQGVVVQKAENPYAQDALPELLRRGEGAEQAAGASGSWMAQLTLA